MFKPQLASTSGWILLALHTDAKTPQIHPVPGAKQLLITSGKAYRKKSWWKSGDDHLAAYEKDLVVWVSGGDAVQANMVDKLEYLLTSKGAKDYWSTS